MRKEVLLIQFRIAPVQVRVARESHAHCRSVDPIGLSFQLKIHADGRFINTNDTRLTRRGEFSPIFLISKTRLVPEPVKYLGKCSRIRNIELDFFAAFIRTGAGGSFISHDGPVARAAEANQLIPGPQRAGVEIEHGIGFKDTRVALGVAGVFDGAPGRVRSSGPWNLDFDFEIGSARAHFVLMIR